MFGGIMNSVGKKKGIIMKFLICVLKYATRRYDSFPRKKVVAFINCIVRY